MISGYRHDRRPALDRSGNDGPYTYDMNTGIIFAYDARQINELIMSNQIGINVK